MDASIPKEDEGETAGRPARRTTWPYLEHPGMTLSDPDALPPVRVPTLAPTGAESPRFYFTADGVVESPWFPEGVRTFLATYNAIMRNLLDDIPDCTTLFGKGPVGPEPGPAKAETWRDRPPLL
jgi:hypothetical protein